jgi:hypothetical protein
VGGHYSESEAGLSKVSFEWILVEAQKAKLKIDDDRANIVLARVPIPVDLRFLPPICNSRRQGCTPRVAETSMVVAGVLSAQRSPKSRSHLVFSPRPMVSPDPGGLIHTPRHIGRWICRLTTSQQYSVESFKSTSATIATQSCDPGATRRPGL